MFAYEPLPSTLEQLARLAMKTDAADIVIGVRQPQAGLERALAETEARCVLALEHPRLAVSDLIQDAGAGPMLATRAVANSCALLMPYGALPGTLLLHADGARADMTGTVMAMARHFGVGIGAEAAQAIVRELQKERPDYPAGGKEWTSRVPEGSRKMVGGALSGYEECFAGRGIGRFVWNRDLFLVGDPERRPGEVLDISGDPGTLIFGPYIHLPAGAWTARIHLGVCAEAARCPLLLDVSADGRQHAVFHFQPSVPGIHVADLPFVLGEPGRRGVEVRVTVLSPEATGRLALGYVMLTPPGVHHPEAVVEWEEQFRATAEL